MKSIPPNLTVTNQSSTIIIKPYNNIRKGLIIEH